MARNTPWSRIVAEGVAIVLSILLAFGIQAWWEGRHDRALEQSYLIRLQSELVDGKADLLRHQRRQQRTLAAMDTLLARENDGRILVGPEIAPTILNAASYELNTAAVLFDHTYGEMLATGSLGLIQDLSVREAITEYYRLAYRLSDLIEEATDTGYRNWATRIRSAMGTQARAWFSSTPSQEQDMALALQPSDEQANRLVTVVGSDSGWLDDVRLARGRIEALDFLFGNLVEAADALVVLVSSEIG